MAGPVAGSTRGATGSSSGLDCNVTPAKMDEDSIDSDVEYSRGEVHKERVVKGNVSNFMMIECVNITSFERNMRALMKSKATAIFFQEHNSRAVDVTRIKEILGKDGWAMLCSPSDETGKNAAAGVGVMWRAQDVNIFEENIKYEKLTKAREMGRASKYVMGVGWGEAIWYITSMVNQGAKVTH